MCIFSQPVRNVWGTLIFARHSGQGTQYLAYQMQYKSDVSNAMILPVPVALPAREDSVKFISLEEYEFFFEYLNSAFPNMGDQSKSAGNARGPDALAVEEVGDFVASFVPTLSDFPRLDPQFVIPKETWDQIPGYKDYGFVVFQLKPGISDPHPMAFEFETRETERLYFPTVHIHDGEVHAMEQFDHRLFMQHAGLDSVVGEYEDYNILDGNTGFVRSKEVAAKSCDLDLSQGMIAGDLLIHKVSLVGTLPNKDQRYTVSGDPLVVDRAAAALAKQLVMKKAWSWVAAGVTLSVLGFSWLVSRRNRLQKTEQKS